MAGKTITFRFPASVVEAIEVQARATGSNRTAVVMEALAIAYGMPEPSVNPVSTDTLQQRINQLEQQILTLLQQLPQVSQQDRQIQPVQIQPVAEGQTVEDRPQATCSTGVIESLFQSELLTATERQTEKLDQILSATPDLIFTQDRLGRFTYLNMAGSRVWGVDRSYFLGKTFAELGFFREVEASFAAHREAVFATGQPVSGEVSIPTLHETREYEYILSPVQGANNTIDAVVCTARDITERKRADQELRKSEEKYRNLFEFANDSIFIVDIATHQILNVNQNGARRLGYTRRELLQLSIDAIESPSVMTYRENIVMPELQKTGSVVYEHILRRKDDREILVEISSRVIEYEDRLALQNFVRDITERKGIEERLHLLESAVLNTTDAIVMTDNPSTLTSSKVVHLNQAFTDLTGYGVADFFDRSPLLLDGLNTDRHQLERIRAAMQQSQAISAELINYRKDGSEFWVNLAIVPFKDREGCCTHWMAVRRQLH